MIDIFFSYTSRNMLPPPSPNSLPTSKANRSLGKAAKKCLPAAVAFLVLGLSAVKTLADPILIYDVNLQNCVNEHMVANEWSNAEDITYLYCPQKGIVDTIGIEQFPNLVKLDLSHNPLQHMGDLHNLQLQDVNLSHTRLYDLGGLGGQQSLVKLLLNNISFEHPENANGQEALLLQLLQNNENLTHIGINGFLIDDIDQVFHNLPRGLLSLQISNIGLNQIPFSPEQLPNLSLLDVSKNPIDHLGPLYDLRDTLTYLDASETQLFDLYDLTPLRSLTHIFLNNIRFAETVGSQEELLHDILTNNPAISHVGINGLKIADFNSLFNLFSSSLTSLEISNTGLVSPPVPFDQFPQLNTLDVSQNPLEHLGPLYSLQNQLQELDLSGTRVQDLHMLYELRALTKLRLNEIAFSALQDPTMQTAILQEVLLNNPQLTHLAINGLNLKDPQQIFSMLSPKTKALELSDLGLTHIPASLEQYASLTMLDLSNNPLDHVGPLAALRETLQYIDLSGTKMYGLYDFSELTQLTHLFLNNVKFEDTASIENELYDLLSQNKNLKHLGLSGIKISDSHQLLNRLSSRLITLEISNIGLSDVHIPLEQFPALKKLDASHNGVVHLPAPQNLQHLNLSGSRIFDFYELKEMRSLNHLYLNDVELISDPYTAEQAVQEILANNPQLTHIGVNGLAIGDFQGFFEKLSPDLVSLELSKTGLASPPVPFEQFPRLKILNVSHNPLDYIGPLRSLQTQLQELDVSNTRIQDLDVLRELRALTKLRLNNVASSSMPHPQAQDDLVHQVLLNNPGLLHVGLNGLALNNPYQLFDMLSPAVEALELSGLGLSHLPVPLEQYTHLTMLDLSNNPLDHLGPLQSLQDSLRYLNLSGTKLHDLYDIREFSNLSHLLLNDIAFEYGVTIEQDLFDLLQKNSNLTHVAINGITINDPYRLSDLLSPQLLSLEMSRIGLEDESFSLDKFHRLKKLDASYNGLVHLPVPPPLYETLEYLDLSGSRLYDLYDIHQLRALRHLYLNGIELLGDSYTVEQDINDILANNPQLTHIGLNGLAFEDFHNLFTKFSPNLVSLELSGTGVQTLPVPIEQFSQLKILDLSHNPLLHLGPLFDLQSTLEELDLSDTVLENLYSLTGLHALKKLRLNNIAFSGSQNPYEHGQMALDLLEHNPSLVEVALNGLQINDPYRLFENLSQDLEVLELSDLGLTQLPLPLEQFEKLRVLDLSGNPLSKLGYLMSLHDTLERINLSDTHLYDLYDLEPFTNLTHLQLNNIQFSGSLTPYDLEQQVRGLISNNPRLTHVGLSGIALESGTIQDLAMLPLVWLEVAQVGLTDLFFPPQLLDGLRHLNAASNGLTNTHGLEAADQLEHLNLANNALTDITNLVGGLPSVKTLTLFGNDTIACADLEALEAELAPDVDYTGPATCDSPDLEPEPVNYCVASANSSSYEWINSISLGGQVHVSGNNGGYGDLSTINFTLQKDAAAPIQLNPGFSSGSYTEYWKVWIDYNHDGNFSASEEVISGSSRSSVNGQIFVPTHAAVGTVRMRVAMQYGSPPSSCGFYTWGEVEDYAVTISE